MCLKQTTKMTLHIPEYALKMSHQELTDRIDALMKEKDELEKEKQEIMQRRADLIIKAVELHRLNSELQKDLAIKRSMMMTPSNNNNNERGKRRNNTKNKAQQTTTKLWKWEA